MVAGLPIKPNLQFLNTVIFHTMTMHRLATQYAWNLVPNIDLVISQWIKISHLLIKFKITKLCDDTHQYAACATTLLDTTTLCQNWAIYIP